MSLTLLPFRPAPAFRIAVTSAGGDARHASVSISLAAALARMGRRVARFDAADEAGGLASLSSAQWTRVRAALAGASIGRDFLLMDTAAGAGDTAIDLIGLADYALVVTSHEPAALVDAYAVVKLLTTADAGKPIGVLVDAARDEHQAAVVFRQLSRASEKFLGRSLRNDGYIVDDPGPCFTRLAARLAAWRPIHPGPGPASAASVSSRRPSPAFAEAPRCA